MNDKQVRTFLNTHRPTDIPDIWDRIQAVPLPSGAPQATVRRPCIAVSVAACIVLFAIAAVGGSVRFRTLPLNPQPNSACPSAPEARSSAAPASDTAAMEIRINPNCMLDYKLGGILRDATPGEWSQNTPFSAVFQGYELSYQTLYPDDTASASPTVMLLTAKRGDAWFSICYMLGKDTPGSDDWPSGAQISKINGADVCLAQYDDHFYASFGLNGHTVLLETCNIGENEFVALVQDVLRL